METQLIFLMCVDSVFCNFAKLIYPDSFLVEFIGFSNTYKIMSSVRRENLPSTFLFGCLFFFIP